MRRAATEYTHMHRPPPPSECPVCGEDVPPEALACPNCGADERSGWDEEATRYDGLDLPDEAWGEPPITPRPRRSSPWTAVAAALAIVALIVWLLR